MCGRLQDGPNQISSEWWAAAFDGVEDEFEQVETLSSNIRAMSKASDLGDLQRQVLEALAIATSPMLEPDRQRDPYKPAIQLNGRRSEVPGDLTPKQLQLLAQVAPLIEQPSLRARVADIAWWYGDRSRRDLRDLAVESYRSFPLDPDHWFAGGEEAWRRALQIAKMLGSGGAALREELRAALEGVIDEAVAERRFFLVKASAVLADSFKLSAGRSLEFAEKFVRLASEVLPSNPRLSRHFEREAADWFVRGGEQAKALACRARIAETYVAAADARMAADPPNPLAATLDLEKAITTVRGLPRDYRGQNGLDARVKELRMRLQDGREATLEAMTTVTSDAVDMAEYARQARTHVSGKEPLEALVRFTNLVPWLDKERAFVDAEENLDGSLDGVFPEATLSGDGRKVAATSGRDDVGFLWTRVVRNFGLTVQLITDGLILPMQEQLLLEHRFSLDDLAALCDESPLVPPRRTMLWARGLWHGFNEDYPSAVSVLVPQIEQLVRFRLKQLDVNTLMVDEVTKVETEKSLGALLVQDGVEEAFGSGLVTELRALLVEQGGANLRNDIAHGLLDDVTSWSRSSVYAWWLALRLVVTPLWHMNGAVPGA